MESFKEKLLASKKTFMVGVAGDSGTGKTTFVSGIKKILGDELVASICLDDYHTQDREQRKRTGLTPLDPAANDLEKAASDLARLKAGEAIEKPVYDHSDGRIKGPVEFKPKPVIIVEGLHPLYTEGLRDLMDFKVFVEPQRKIKEEWKIRRDIEKRGHKRGDLEEEMKKRALDYEKHIDSQKIYAEVLVKVAESQASEEDDIYLIELQQRMLEAPLPELDLSIDLSHILRLAEKNFTLNFRKDVIYGCEVGILGLDGEIHREVAESLEEKLCCYTGKYGQCIFGSQKTYITTTELSQLIICWRFLEKISYLMKQ